MATAKKTPKKPVVITTEPRSKLTQKVAAKKVVKPAVKKAAPAKQEVKKAGDQTYMMPVEVKEWIDQATSRIRHLTNENQRLKEELAGLRRANRNMEARVMGSIE